MNEKFKTVNE